MAPRTETLPHLDELLRQRPGQSRILLVPSRPAGHQMLERLARKGLCWANVRVLTVGDLALEAATPVMARRGLARATRIQSHFLVDELIRSGRAGRWFLAGSRVDQGGLRAAPGPTDGLIRAAHRSLMELRRHGLTAEALNPTAFSPTAKGEALVELLTAYEARLDALALVDGPGILRLAVEALRASATPADSEDAPWFLIPAPLELEGLERELVHAASRGRRLRFDPGAGGPGTIQFFHATAPAAELRSVLRRVAARGIPLDQVEVVATDAGAYAGILRALAARLNLPVTFSDGLPMEETAPGRGALAYLDWMAAGYPTDLLAAALAAGDLVPGPDLSGDQGGPGDGGSRPSDRGRLLASALLETGIGWGWERYRSWLRRQAGRGARERGTTEREAEGELARFLDELLRLTPSPDADEAGLAGGVAALRAVVTRFTVERSALDRGGRVALLQTLEGLERVIARERTAVLPAGVEAEAAAAQEGPVSEPFTRVAARLRAWLAGLAVGQGEPRPGALHLATLDQGGYAGRPHVFLVGLDEGRFPGKGGEDPLLLDSDRARLPGALPGSGDRLSTRRQSLEHLVERIEGSLTCSFASRDPLDGQEVAPSPALLDLFRRATGHGEADYSALREALGAPEGTVPPGNGAQGPVLDGSEGWLAAMRVGPPGGERLVLPGGGLDHAFPLLAAGREAENARKSERLTAYDGLVEADSELDPRQTGVAVSAGRLETLATCPLRYFFRYVLRIAPPDRPQFDPEHWLDPLGRGSLLHEIYRAFVDERIRSGRAVAPMGEEDRRRMEQIALAAIDRTRLDVPPPSEGVFDRERREIVDEALFFVDLEARRDDGGEPVLLEQAFGMGGDPPVELDLTADPSRPERLKLSGRIDRVDRLPDGTYAVWDYKTGSARRYESDRTYLEGGRQLQHVLYALAAESILRRAGVDSDPRVSRSGYLLTSRRGRGHRADRPQDPGRQDQARELLRILLGVAASGTFAPGPDAVDLCAFCDYRPACDGPEAVRRVKEKARAGEARLAFWEEVRRYE